MYMPRGSQPGTLDTRVRAGMTKQLRDIANQKNALKGVTSL
jgi:hypothetical protein